MKAPTRNGGHYMLSRPVALGRTKLLHVDGKRIIRMLKFFHVYSEIISRIMHLNGYVE